MIKIIFIGFVLIIVFSSALYLGILGGLTDNFLMIQNDFLVFIPMELRLGFFLIILGLGIGSIKAFTK